MDRMVAVPEESNWKCPSKDNLDKSATSLNQEPNSSLIVKPTPNIKPSNMVNALNILNAENWLKDNLQNSWWSKAYVNDKPESKHNYSNSASL